MSKLLPTVAIIMATYNGERFISEQIKSIVEQQGVKIKIYFRDDGSIDGTMDIISEFCNANPDLGHIVTDVYGQQRSPGKNFFRLFMEVPIEEYDYLALSDQDDIWLTDKLRIAISTLGAKFEGYSSNLTIWDGHRKVGLLTKSPNQTQYDYLFQTASAGCTYVLTSSAAQVVREKSKNYILKLHDHTAHDLVIYAIVRACGMKWYHDTNNFILYRQHENNVYGANTSYKKLLRMIAMVNENWYGTILEDAIVVTGSDVDFVNNMFSKNIFVRLSSLKYINITRREPISRIFLAVFVIIGLLKRTKPN